MLLRRIEAKDLFFRDDGFIKTAAAWVETKEVLSIKYSEKNTRKVSKLFVIPAIIILLQLLLVYVEPAMTFISQSLQRKNSIFLATQYFSGISSFFRLTVIFLCLISIAVSLFQPVFTKELVWPDTILMVYCWYAICFFLLVLARKYDGSCEDDKETEGRIPRLSPLVYLFALWSALLIMVSTRFLAPFFSQEFSVLFISLLRIGWLFFSFLILRGLWQKSEYGASWRLIRLVLLVLVATLVLMEIAGFRSIVFLVLTNICKTAILFVLLVFAVDSVDLITKILHSYSAKMSVAMGLDKPVDTTKSSSMTMLSIGGKVLLLALCFLLFCQIWDITHFQEGRFYSIIMDGISFGGLSVFPGRIIFAFIIFALCWPLVGFIKPLIEKKWLVPSSISESSRETFLTLTGYLGYALIVIAALSIAGIKLTGLTVVIGALSLGIGFGLQNIINNFISGLIIMFERPIKKGDWIQVGSTEGYVKKISIRSTIIQTFDRSDVIVPNSELIANQVTNMMLYDQQGRLRVSVGVAYGSNTKLVKDLLAEVADNHPQVITDGSTPGPRVLFQAFGDSSLNFDLLCHLKDIDKKIQVRSEMHFAIDSAFRENGIEIPFPQRDIHIRSQPQAAANEVV